MSKLACYHAVKRIRSSRRPSPHDAKVWWTRDQPVRFHPVGTRVIYPPYMGQSECPTGVVVSREYLPARYRPTAIHVCESCTPRYTGVCGFCGWTMLYKILDNCPDWLTGLRNYHHVEHEFVKLAPRRNKLDTLLHWTMK